MSKRCFAPQAVDVLAGSDEELSGVLDTDPEQLDRTGSRLADELTQLLVELFDLLVEVGDAARKTAQRELRCLERFAEASSVRAEASAPRLQSFSRNRNTPSRLAKPSIRAPSC